MTDLIAESQLPAAPSVGDALPLSCSVVVATRFRPELLDRCLSALAAQRRPALEIIVVDNSDGDERTRAVARKFDATYTVAPATGLSRARNVGMRTACGDIVAFLDDDAVPVPDWIAKITEPFVDPFVAAVAGQILPAEVASEAQRWSLGVRWHILGSERREFNLTTSDWFEKANFGGIGSGLNMAIRRRALDEWPGFRETFGLGAPLGGGEENYAFFELIRLGFTVVYSPDVAVQHPLPSTFDELRERRRRLLSQATAYMALIAYEEPAFRGRVVRFAGRKVIQRLRSPRRPNQPSWRAIMRFTDVAGAFAKAPVLVWRCRRQNPLRQAGR